jgi:hypothetical protein
MIEPVERTAALRTFAARPWARRAERGRPAGSTFAFANGEIAGNVRLLEHDRPERRAVYEVLVANGTAFPVAAFAYALEGGHRPGRITWNAIVVPPHSAIAVEIDVVVPRRAKPPRVIAEVHSRDAALTLDSVAPLAAPSGTLVRRTGATAATLALGAAAVAAGVSNLPRVAALAAPSSAVAGDAFSVAYAMSHASGGEYTVEAPDGLQVRRGPLPAGAGAFSVSLPVGPMPGGYDLHVYARGRFGSDERTLHIAALPPPTAPLPAKPQKHRGFAIEALQLRNEFVLAGSPIVVSYRTGARVGTVRLIDESGTVRAEALLSRTGTSLLVAPAVDVDQDLRVVVTAEHGPLRDEAETPVRVLHVPQISTPLGAASLAAIPVVPAPLGAPASFAAPPVIHRAPPIPHGPPIAVARTQSAGAPIVVRIVRYEPKLHVAVLGASGEELEGTDVGPDDRVVQLDSPRDLGTSHPSIVATYTHGREQEMVIRPVAVHGSVKPAPPVGAPGRAAH